MSSVKHGKTRRRDREVFMQRSGIIPEFDAQGTHRRRVIVLHVGRTLTVLRHGILLGELITADFKK
jgi:hypothetical protein